jgi:hypothetical protein
MKYRSLVLRHSSVILMFFILCGSAPLLGADEQRVSFTVAPVKWALSPSAIAKLRIDGPFLVVDFDRLTFRFPRDAKEPQRVARGLRLSISKRGDVSTRRLSNWVPLGTKILRGSTEKVENIEAIIPIDGIALRDLESYELWLEVFVANDGGAVAVAPPDTEGFVAAMARPRIDSSQLLR